MRLKNIITGIVLSGFAHTGQAQQRTITLEEALQQAEKNYPAAKQKQLVEAAGHQNQQLLDASLFPQINVTGQAAYQSEVTSLDMPGLPKGLGQKPDNYNVGLEMRLPLTQFSAVKTRKQLEQAQTELSLAQLDAEVQKVRERITSLFGNVLLQKENQNILKLRISDLDQQRKKVAVGVAAGAVLKSNQLVFDSEILSTEQRISDIGATLEGLIKQLSLLTGTQLDTGMQFKLTDVKVAQNIDRPELKALESQTHILDLQAQLLKKESRPNVYVFGQGYYGRPGYNFLDTDFRTYGIGGVGLSWNLNNLFTRLKRERVIDINKEMVGKQEETFRLNLEASLAQQQAEINKYENIISKDAGIVKARQEILRAASSQLENGVITSTEYLIELNAENTAELNLVLHQVQLSIAKAQYNTLAGY